MLKLIVSAVALAAVTPLAASAAEPAPRSVVVHTGDLDLATAEGQEALDDRIKDAVGIVCGKPNLLDIVENAANRGCRKVLTRTARREARVLIARRTGQGSTLASR